MKFLQVNPIAQVRSSFSSVSGLSVTAYDFLALPQL
jgi:hypothetical protein